MNHDDATLRETTAISDSQRRPVSEPRKFSSSELFAGARELVIEHAGGCYRLRLTQHNRLILTK